MVKGRISHMDCLLRIACGRDNVVVGRLGVS